MPKRDPARLARIIEHLRAEPGRTSPDVRVRRARRVEAAYLQALQRGAGTTGSLRGVRAPAS